MAFRTTRFTGRVHLPKLGRRQHTPKNLVLGVEQFPATNRGADYGRQHYRHDLRGASHPLGVAHHLLPDDHRPQPLIPEASGQRRSLARG